MSHIAMQGQMQKRPSTMDASIDGDFSVSSMEDFDASRHALTASQRTLEGASTPETKEPEKDRIATTETTVVRTTKFLVIIFLTATAVTLSVLINKDVTQYEKDLFESAYNDGSQAILNRFQFNLEGVINTVNSVGMQMTTWAQASNSSWPNIALPDFEAHAGNARLITGAQSISVISIVQDGQQRPDYESFVQDNLDWVGGDASEESIYPEIFRIVLNERESETPPGPYFPYFQSNPAIASAVNFNTGSSSLLSEEVQATLNSNQVLLGKELTLIRSPIEGLLPDQEGPILPIYFPIFESLEGDRASVALISALLGWSTLLQDVSSSGEGEYIAVIDNACSGAVTFEMNESGSSFLGRGDLHEEKFNKYKDSFPFDRLFGTGGQWIDINDSYCPYMLNIYPSQALRDSYESDRALLYTLAVGLLFGVTLIFFLVFNKVVEYRQRQVMQHALEARAVVASLFPAGVREQLLEEQRDLNREKGKKEKEKKIVVDKLPASIQSSGPSSDSDDSSEGDDDGDDRDEFDNDMDEIKPPSFGRRPGRSLVRGPSMRQMTKSRSVRRFGNQNQSSARIKSFLDEANRAAMEKQESAIDIEVDKPIADLYPNTTILFSDLVGFTSWSSQRDPEQVFTLLQVLYKTFDAEAKKRGVFKVETIGDCYMAVTGLPDPQSDHAWRMVKFALECRRKMSKVTRELQTKLGPDTADLSMRCGLHSGAVTAGVLRGEKSRFQLFGDTVNMASRMESTGLKNRIQISQATADILMSTGKGSWIRPREELVQAKGKGTVKTYWVASRPKKPSKKSRTVRINVDGSVASGESTNKAARFRDRASAVGNTSRSRLSSFDSNYTSGEDIESGDESFVEAWAEGDKSTVFELPPLPQEKSKRKIIDYQSDMLIDSLKLIASKRDNAPNSVEHIQLKVNEGDSIILDELSEVIKLPEFDPEVVKKQRDPSQINLGLPVLGQLHDYITTVASLYPDIEFHNFEHASHVVANASKMLNRIVVPEVINEGLAEELHSMTDGINSDPLAHFAVIFSALIHDLDYSGVGNEDLAKEDADLAELYRGRSLAEQKSLDMAWDLLMQEDYGELRASIYSNEEELARLRKILVNCVLSTDLYDRELRTFRETRWSKVFPPKSESGEAAGPPTYITESNAKATIIMELIVQTSNIAHTMQHFQVYRKWNFRLFCEMYTAFQEGRSQEDPSKSWYEKELSFFDDHVIPLAKKLKDCEVFGVLATECVNNSIENRNEFAEFGQEMVYEYLQEYQAKQSDGDQRNEVVEAETKPARSTVSSLRSTDDDDEIMSSLNGSADISYKFDDSMRPGDSAASLNLSRVFHD